MASTLSRPVPACLRLVAGPRVFRSARSSAAAARPLYSNRSLRCSKFHTRGALNDKAKLSNPSDSQLPKSPSRRGPSLTEYSANPPCPAGETPPSAEALVPDAFLLPDGTPDYLRLILTARVYEVIDESPLSHAVNISNRLGCDVHLKREDLLPVFSFKLRGAYNKMAHLSPEERERGVVACSAGNHAQGVAFSSRHLKIPSTIVMPSGTPSIKHQNVTRLGGKVVLFGPDFDSAKEECSRLEKLEGLTNIPPFDDPYVIAGQGTIGMEILRQSKIENLEAVFCGIGGGGLIAGIGTYLKRIAPHVKIIGVETYDANAMVQSLQEGKRVTLKDVGLFADGAAVKSVGAENFRLCNDVVDEVIQVSTDEVCAAIKDVFMDTRSIVEPAGALSLAGLKKYVAKYPSSNQNRSLVAVTSGANMNFDRLGFVAERAALGEQREALLSVNIPERPGAFAELVKAVLPNAVTEFSYRYATPDSANVLMGISLRSAASRESDLASLFDRLSTSGMTAVDLSGDELAKTHVRYLVGGRSAVSHERLYTFEFPERPGALAKFLTTLRPGFNISLFHYRNHGGDVGKVVAGIQCPDEELPQLEDFLRDLQYPFVDETENLTYQRFLRD
ncbi:putative threonine dehydratase mitochondrial precursor [Xylona heveae TC161]|uniref:Threonine dehydratase n=1 Tax=Xylona heveae (strain CBS 132557 / TC161) TaxID=1328760 RepID=A0A165JH84_XYLHT|nr:putative threonine dehydratase mitochondrial precursor [Xylona heveae TC161]KZF26237.1 putative threonine dehydratase mitochondrial precursor [Xylona heveae TC161]